MLKLYGADLSGPSNKIRFTANKLGIEYEYILVALRNKEHKEQWFLELNPVGKIPVIDDEGFVLSESDAIIKYLSQREQSELYPSDIKERAVVDQWMDFVSIHVCGAMNRVIFNRVFAKYAQIEVDEKSLKTGLSFLHRFLPVVDKQLDKNKYLAGDSFSLADISLLATLDPVEVGKIHFDDYKNVSRWRKALQSEDFYLKCHKSYGEKLKEVFKG